MRRLGVHVEESAGNKFHRYLLLHGVTKEQFNYGKKWRRGRKKMMSKGRMDVDVNWKM